ncbi:hypothetical protein ILYODFUR_022057 [Ilyodon furcidens]|uniref:Uncharacterized protein n=1 Tax=Ilyodon furcidens TaxID=33524 RepID=A0ABV0VGG8_9TELE
MPTSPHQNNGSQHRDTFSLPAAMTANSTDTHKYKEFDNITSLEGGVQWESRKEREEEGRWRNVITDVTDCSVSYE